MWVVAGVLLGSFVVLAALGLHTGPHSHLLGAAIGVVAAIWLLVMAASGDARTVVWTLFGLDVLASGAIGLAARHGLRHRPSRRSPTAIAGREGLALSDLVPDGIVRVAGEEWSATSLNGPVPRGARVQVVDGHGVRLEVWPVHDPELESGTGPDRGD